MLRRIKYWRKYARAWLRGFRRDRSWFALALPIQVAMWESLRSMRKQGPGAITKLCDSPSGEIYAIFNSPSYPQPWTEKE